MDHPHRLRKAARACYYLGWASALFAFLDVVLKMDKSLLAALGISGRNLLEASFLFFLISTASAVRAMGGMAEEDKPPSPKGQAA
jgi:hypothetical protein